MNSTGTTTIESIMSRTVVTVNHDATFLDLMKSFQKDPFHYLPVLDNDKNVIGIVYRSDYYQMLYSFDIYGLDEDFFELSSQLSSITVIKVMRENILKVPKDLPIPSAVSYLRSDIKNALLVFDQGKLAGIVTIQDIFNYIYSRLKA